MYIYIYIYNNLKFVCLNTPTRMSECSIRTCDGSFYKYYICHPDAYIILEFSNDS